MKNVHNIRDSDHQKIFLLLPWYVNNTLYGQEKQKVEEHLKVCRSCQNETACLKELSVAVNQVDSLEAAAHASYIRLKQHIHEAEKSQIKQNITLNPVHSWLNKINLNSLFGHRPALALVAVVLFLLVMPLYFNKGEIHQDEFKTLSDPGNIAGKENEIRVVFANDLDRQQMNNLLKPLDAEIINGPSPQGVYIVRLSSKPSANELLNIIISLRKNPKVIFAEPTYAWLSSGHADGAGK
ncbi:MAG: zf-HC2 domain-containing protein [Methylococcaceae bacterium]